MLSIRASRLLRVPARVRCQVKSFADAAASTEKAGVKAPPKVSAPAADSSSASSSSSTLGQRLSSCLVGMAIGYSVSFYMLTEELQESNRVFSERLSKIEASLNIK